MRQSSCFLNIYICKPKRAGTCLWKIKEQRKRRQQTFHRPVRMAGIIHRSGMSVLQLYRFQRLRPPFSSLLTWCAHSKGFSCSWKRCYGCLEQKIKDHLLFIKQIFKTFEEANRGTFSCVFCLVRPSSQFPKTRPAHKAGQKAPAALSLSLSFPLLLALPSLPTHLPFSYHPLTTILCSWLDQKRILPYIKSTVLTECFVVFPCVCLWPTDSTGLVLPEDMFVIFEVICFPWRIAEASGHTFSKEWCSRKCLQHFDPLFGVLCLLGCSRLDIIPKIRTLTAGVCHSHGQTRSNGGVSCARRWSGWD